MKVATYKLAGEVSKTAGIAGMEIGTREAETTEEFLTLVKDGKPEHMLQLAQSALDIIVQRYIRNGAEDEVTAAILAGKTVTKEQDEAYEGDYSSHSDDERRDVVKQRLQGISDAYVYGSRGPATGASSVTKKKAAMADNVAKAAAEGKLSDAAKAELAALGFEF